MVPVTWFTHRSSSLDLDGEVALPDNFFDVFPGIPTVLAWPESLPAPRILRTGNPPAA
jgi:hypothetical protein